MRGLKTHFKIKVVTNFSFQLGHDVAIKIKVVTSLNILTILRIWD